MPFLDEREWQEMTPFLDASMKAIKTYRARHDRDLDAHEGCMAVASVKFEELTGMPDVHFWTIHHHRLKDWGKECPSCGCLLMTPATTLCSHCGWHAEATETVPG